MFIRMPQELTIPQVVVDTLTKGSIFVSSDLLGVSTTNNGNNQIEEVIGTVYMVQMTCIFLEGETRGINPTLTNSNWLERDDN